MRVEPAAGDAGILRQRFPEPVLAGEESAGEREVRQQGEVVTLARVQYAVVLGIAYEHAVLVLYAHEAGAARPAGRTLGLLDLQCGESGAPDRAHLAGPHQPVQRPECFRGP